MEDVPAPRLVDEAIDESGLSTIFRGFHEEPLICLQVMLHQKHPPACVEELEIVRPRPAGKVLHLVLAVHHFFRHHPLPFHTEAPWRLVRLSARVTFDSDWG